MGECCKMINLNDLAFIATAIIFYIIGAIHYHYYWSKKNESNDRNR
jgi:hypothetical protein